MTFFHFGNCVALAYGPYFLTYKYSTLPEYGAFWKCAQVGGIYIFTQLCKMLILATFFPTSEGSSESVNLFHEIIKATIDIGDLLGLSLVIAKTVGGSQSVGSGHIKILTAGLGWAAADLFLTRALPLWVGARGLQFDWKYILMSLDANVSLISHLSVATLIWLWLRNDLAAQLRPLIAILLTFSIYRHLIPVLLNMFMSTKPEGFSLFALTSIPTLCVAFISLTSFYSLLCSCSE
ncbi:Transmembrane protein [Armadillidium nasatum]|uniref:BOS complex subunit TMEM147 n=1 Tax=Armadillidium nasatum TaxID=96803 RepID=A0A5N5SJA8_9CRUS|nr:Transmembrane protein [Armadillidium nasatum]